MWSASILNVKLCLPFSQRLGSVMMCTAFIEDGGHSNGIERAIRRGGGVGERRRWLERLPPAEKAQLPLNTMSSSGIFRLRRTRLP